MGSVKVRVRVSVRVCDVKHLHGNMQILQLEGRDGGGESTALHRIAGSTVGNRGWRDAVMWEENDPCQGGREGKKGKRKGRGGMWGSQLKGDVKSWCQL